MEQGVVKYLTTPFSGVYELFLACLHHSTLRSCFDWLNWIHIRFTGAVRTNSSQCTRTADLFARNIVELMIAHRAENFKICTYVVQKCLALLKMRRRIQTEKKLRRPTEIQSWKWRPPFNVPISTPPCTYTGTWTSPRPLHTMSCTCNPR